MRQAVLGAGGIGALIGAALARAGRDVVLLLRPETFALYRGAVRVESVVLGDFEVEVDAATTLDREVNVLWVAAKATALEAALALAPPERLARATVVPLLNGIDHVALLRARYPAVVVGAIRVESERTDDWVVRQSSPFLRVELGAGGEPICIELRAAGIGCATRADDAEVLWDKLVFLAPLALATSALGRPLGALRADPLWQRRFERAQAEAVAVARAEGVRIDEAALHAMHAAAPAAMRSSMQKDVDAGRAPELDAIGGPIVRAGERHGVDVSTTRELMKLVALRARKTT